MLKIFALHDGSLNDRRVGTLTYDTDRKLFEIEIDGDVPPADLPLSLEIRICDSNRRIGNDEAMSWVRSRICPPGRHNISEILSANGLQVYDEFDILMATKAKCDKDELYIGGYD